MANREAFLADIARQLGRDVRHQPQAQPAPVNTFAQTRLTELTPSQRVDAFIDVATKVMQVHCEQTTAQNAACLAQGLCEQYGPGPVVVSADPRLEQLGITARLQQQCQATIWDPTQGEASLRLTEQAKIGVVYAEYGLAESGGVVLFSSPQRARSVSLLPETSLFVLRQSTILPRVAQLAQILHQQAQQGQRMPSCINLISGPSSTADIELIKVVGVHGPVNAVYLLVED